MRRDALRPPFRRPHLACRCHRGRRRHRARPMHPPHATPAPSEATWHGRRPRKAFAQFAMCVFAGLAATLPSPLAAQLASRSLAAQLAAQLADGIAPRFALALSATPRHTTRALPRADETWRDAGGATRPLAAAPSGAAGSGVECHLDAQRARVAGGVRGAAPPLELRHAALDRPPPRTARDQDAARTSAQAGRSVGGRRCADVEAPHLHWRMSSNEDVEAPHLNWSSSDVEDLRTNQCGES